MYNEKEEPKKSEKKQFTFPKLFRKRKKRLLTDLDHLFYKIIGYEIILSVALIIIGLIFLLSPDIGVQIIGTIVGILLCIYGGLNIYSFLKRKELYFYHFYLIYGLITLILGIYTILNPILFHVVITMGVGLWIFYLAAIKIDIALRLKAIKEETWFFHLITAILLMLMAILMMVNPFKNLLLPQLIGAYFILIGILNCTDLFFIKNRSIDFLENL